MKNKLRILTLITLITMILVGCGNEEKKELRSLHDLGYEYAVKEYNSYAPAQSTAERRQPPIAILISKIANESPISIRSGDEIYGIHKDLIVEEYQNAEKIEALESGYRRGFFECVRSSVEFVSSKKGKKSIDDYLNGIDEINGHKIDDKSKAFIKDRIIMYSDIVLEQINLYEEEYGKYTGLATPVNENLRIINNELQDLAKSDSWPIRMLSAYAYANIWYDQK